MYTRQMEYASNQRRSTADASCTMPCTGNSIINRAAAILASALIFIHELAFGAIIIELGLLGVLLCRLGSKTMASLSEYPLSYR